jgi:hypothetical protein
MWLLAAAGHTPTLCHLEDENDSQLWQEVSQEWVDEAEGRINPTEEPTCFHQTLSTECSPPCRGRQEPVSYYTTTRTECNYLVTMRAECEEYHQHPHWQRNERLEQQILFLYALDSGSVYHPSDYDGGGESEDDSLDMPHHPWRDPRLANHGSEEEEESNEEADDEEEEEKPVPSGESAPRNHGDSDEDDPDAPPTPVGVRTRHLRTMVDHLFPPHSDDSSTSEEYNSGNDNRGKTSTRV